jgi:CHAD domain-containing protein
MRATGRHELTRFRLPPVGGRPLEARVFTSVYYDVPGGSLASVGITLLRRTDGGRGVWELRLPAEESCLALEEDGARGQPPSTVLKLLQAHLGHGPLERIAELRTRRSGELIEVELELRSASLAHLDLLARELTARGGPSRVETADASDGPIEALRSLLRAQLREIERHDPGTRLGRDPESLHDMRVAVRRTRALLRAGKKLISADMSELDGRLKELGAVLGEVRDLDVLLARLEEETAELGGEDAMQARSLLAALRTERSCSRARLLAALRSEQYLSLLDDAARAIEELRPSGAAVTLDDVADRAFAKVRRAVHALPDEPADAELHRVRKLGKRARYAAELVSRKEFVRWAKALQDVLGEHQDAVVAAARLRQLAVGASPGQALAAGRLVEREQARRAATRATWREAWKRLRKTI